MQSVKHYLIFHVIYNSGFHPWFPFYLKAEEAAIL
jgi:hypothetical protein